MTDLDLGLVFNELGEVLMGYTPIRLVRGRDGETLG
jgi:hypothetical protein